MDLICKWMLLFVAKYRLEFLVSWISERANDVAVRLVMTILDNEGLAHCFYCPSRFSLRKVNLRNAKDELVPAFVCPKHVPLLTTPPAPALAPA